MRSLRHLPSRLTDPAAGARGERRIVALLVLLALGLRLLRLGFQPLWWDEGWSVYFATADAGTLLRLTAVDIHPPLYYLALNAWIRLLGAGPVSVRLLSVLAGTAAVPLLYRVGRRLLGTRGGLLAAALLATSPLHIYYSQEVRMYGLVTLLGLLAWSLALRLEAGEGGAPAWLGYVLAAAAALYTQYYAAFLLLGLNLVVLARWAAGRTARRAGWRWLGAQAAVAALFLPWLWYAGEKLLSYVRFKVGVEQDLPLGPLAYLGRHLAALTAGHLPEAAWWLGLLPLALLVAAAALLLPRRIGARGVWPLALVAAGLACGFAVNFAFPFSAPRNERQLLLALPAYLLLVAAALDRLWERRRRWAALPAATWAAAAAAGLAVFYAVARYPQDDYRPLAARIGALGRPGDAVVCVHPWQVGYLRSYLPPAARPDLVLTPREVLPHERQLWADDPARMASDLDALLAAHRRVWLPAHQAMGRVLEDPIRDHLAGRAAPALSEWYGENTVLSLFAAAEAAPRPVAARFGPWLALEGVALTPGPVEAGWGVVAVDLDWRLAERPAEPYSVGLRLVDAQGQVWGQRDAQPGGGQEPFTTWPVGQPQRDRHGLLVPAGTPPGDYRVLLRVYRSAGLEPLPVADPPGGGVEVDLGSVQVVRPQAAPSPAALRVEVARRADWGALRWLGNSLPAGGALLPGEELALDLFWQALAAPGEDLLPRLRLVDAAGQVVGEFMDKPVNGRYPTAWWQGGELVRDPHTLSVPAAAQPGRHLLMLSLVRAADGRPLAARGGQTQFDLAEVEVRGREPHTQPMQPQHVQAAALGAAVQLVGYDLDESVRTRGSPLAITLYWHALQTPDRAYHSFVHLLDAGGTIVAQSNGVPGQGELPSRGWLPGETLPDTRRLTIPLNLPNGSYRLGVGLYDPPTGQRLGERILLGSEIRIGDEGGCGCP